MGRVFRRPCLINFMKHDETFNPAADDAYRDKPRQASKDILISSAWASIIPIRGMEYEQFHSRQSKMRCHIKVDWIEGQGVDAAAYIQYGARLFDILAVLDDSETKVDITFVCEEKLTGV